MKVFKCQYCYNNYHGNYQQHFCSQQLNIISINKLNIDKKKTVDILLQSTPPQPSKGPESTSLSASK